MNSNNLSTKDVEINLDNLKNCLMSSFISPFFKDDIEDIEFIDPVLPKTIKVRIYKRGGVTNS